MAAIEALGLSTKATSIRAGLVACTGNVGCKFAASDTKRHAEDIARWCEARVALDGPVNIHLTGCHHSCAQHYIGDIGLLGLQGAGLGGGRRRRGLSRPGRRRLRRRRRASRRDIYRDVKAEDVPATVERMLRGYLAHRAGPDETFLAFARRHDVEALKSHVRGGRMSKNLPPPIPALLPESAPFTPEQRAWLNGFFAGLSRPRRRRRHARCRPRRAPG